MMCKITWSDFVGVVNFYWNNLSSVQMRMEFWAAIVSIVFSNFITLIVLGIVTYTLMKYWSKMKILLKVIYIFSGLFFVIVSILAYPQSKENLYYYACKRKPFIREVVVIDTVLGYVYEYDFTCYRGRRSFYRGGGYVKYMYRVLGVDSILKGEYKFEGSFLCDIDTGFYYVIVPRGKWENSIILLERRIPWDTIKAWREWRGQENVEENESEEQ